MYEPDYPVATERLLLRPYEERDVDAVHAYQSLPESVRYVPYGPRTREVVVERVSDAMKHTRIESEGGFLLLVVERIDTGEVIGDVVLFYRSEVHRSGELGYIFNPAHSGHGFATEAANAVLRLGFDGLGLHRMLASMDSRNTASAAVARRLGMRHEAHFVHHEWFKGEWIDEDVWALLDSEWRASRQGGGEISEQVLNVLDADREPDQRGGHLEG